MHELGFTVIDKKKGTYVDGHERPDVVEHRHQFLRKMITCGMFTPTHAPTDDDHQSFPSNIDSPSEDQVKKNTIIFHDESVFNSNEDESTQWGTKDQHFVRPKSKGAGIMVFHFIEEQGGYLELSDEQFEEARKTNPTIKKSARLLLEYGDSHEGYFTCQKFLDQVTDAIAIAEYKYPKNQGYRFFSYLIRVLAIQLMDKMH